MLYRTAICIAFFGLLVCSPFAFAQLDLNGDDVIDCGDAGILHDAILTGSQDTRFDFDGSGDVDQGDFHYWIDSNDARGDVNLDGRVDAQDSNILGINWVQETGGGWCHGDTSLDGRVDARDKGETQLHWMIGGRSPATPSNVVEIGQPLAIWRAGTGAVIAESASFEVVASPRAAPDGLLATVISVRAKIETDRVVTFRDIEFDGDLHQLWIDDPFLVPTTIRDDLFLPESLDPFLNMDSHILVGHSNLGIHFGGGLAGSSEENDKSNPTNQELVYEFFPLATGLGRLAMASPTDAFTLHRGFPDDEDVESAQKQSVDLAHLVTPARMPGTDLPGEVSYRIGVLGSSDLDEPLADMPIFGFDENFPVPFLFRPCDFDRDGVCSTGDLDQLLSAVGDEAPALNLVGDDVRITLADRDAWLSWAADGRFSQPLLVGDTDLNGVVDSLDLNALALRWAQVHGDGWAGGDFDGDGQTSAADLNAMALNWQLDIRQPVASAIPEPSCIIGFFVMVTLTAAFVRSRR